MDDHVFAYVGAYTAEKDGGPKRNAHARGISVYRIGRDRSWTLIQEYPMLNPAVLTFGLEKRFLYSASSDCERVTAFRIGEDGTLSKINEQPINGKDTVVIAVNHRGDLLAAADFYGNICTMKIRKDGGLEPAGQSVSPPGIPGPLRERWQPGSRPHHLVFDPEDRHLLVPDKGFDAIHVYEIEKDRRSLRLKNQLSCRRAGCPRHLEFSGGDTVYCNLEFANLIMACDYRDGLLEPFQIIPTLPETYTGNLSKSSEIKVHPGGRWVYASNRGHDSMAVYQADPDTSMLRPIQWIGCGGKTPRFFAIEPGGRSLYCCNQFSDTITEFEIHPHTGMLRATGYEISTPVPVWLLISDRLPRIGQREEMPGGIT